MVWCTNRSWQPISISICCKSWQFWADDGQKWPYASKSEPRKPHTGLSVSILLWLWQRQPISIFNFNIISFITPKGVMLWCAYRSWEPICYLQAMALFRAMRMVKKQPLYAPKYQPNWTDWSGWAYLLLSTHFMSSITIMPKWVMGWCANTNRSWQPIYCMYLMGHCLLPNLSQTLLAHVACGCSQEAFEDKMKIDRSKTMTAKQQTLM